MNYFQIAWDIAKKADKKFGYWGGKKQFFNEALKMAYAGYNANDIIGLRSQIIAERLSKSSFESAKHLHEGYFLVNTSKGQYILSSYQSLLFSNLSEIVTLSWKTDTHTYKQDLTLLQALKELNNFKEMHKANIKFHIN